MSDRDFNNKSLAFASLLQSPFRLKAECDNYLVKAKVVLIELVYLNFANKKPLNIENYSFSLVSRAKIILEILNLLWAKLCYREAHS